MHRRVPPGVSSGEQWRKMDDALSAATGVLGVLGGGGGMSFLSV